MPNKNKPTNPALRRTKSDKSLRDVALILFRNRKSAVFTFALILAATLGYIFSSDTIYRSESKVLIQLGRENVAVDPSVTGPTVSVYQQRENEVNSEISILKSRPIIENTVDSLDPAWILGTGPSHFAATDFPFLSPLRSVVKKSMLYLGLRRNIPLRDRAVSHVRDRFSVVAEKRSNVIILTYTDTTPEKSRQILNRLLATYLDHHIEVHKTQASPIFFEEQASRLEQELGDKERELKEFRTKFGFTSVETQKNSIQHQIESMQTERDRAAGLVGSTKARIASLEKELRGKNRIIELSRVSGRQNAIIEGIKSKLMELRMQEMDLSSRYSDSHRPLQEVRGQIAASEELLRREQSGAGEEVTTGVNNTYQLLQIDLASARSELDSHLAMQRTLDRELATRKTELQALLDQELTERELERETALLQQEYMEYRNNLQRAVRDEQMDRSKVANVSIVQSPTFGTTPVNPMKALEISIGVLMALIGGMLSALISESMKHSFKDSVDVEKNIGVQVLATIPKQKQ